MAGIMRNVPPGISSKEERFIILPYIDLKTSFSIENPTSGYIVDLIENKDQPDLINQINSEYTYWPIDTISKS